MIKSKLLIDTSSWKDVLAKNKAVKDNGLLKTLGEIKGLGEGDHDDAQKILDEVLKLSTQLKKSKEAAANPAVTKFLAELASAADTAQKDVAKAKAEADKKGKADAEAKKREEAKGGAEEGEGEEEEASALLTTKMIPLAARDQQGRPHHARAHREHRQAGGGADLEEADLARAPEAAGRRARRERRHQVHRRSLHEGRGHDDLRPQDAGGRHGQASEDRVAPANRPAREGALPRRRR